MQEVWTVCLLSDVKRTFITVTPPIQVPSQAADPFRHLCHPLAGRVETEGDIGIMDY